MKKSINLNQSNFKNKDSNSIVRPMMTERHSLRYKRDVNFNANLENSIEEVKEVSMLEPKQEQTIDMYEEPRNVSLI